MAQIDELSVRPVWLTTLFQGREISHATGFFVRKAGAVFLLTNWHVVTGKDAETGNQEIQEPDELAIWYHVGGKLNAWEAHRVRLRDQVWDPTWVEHPLGRLVDVVAISLAPPEHADVYDVDLSMADADLAVWPGSAVSVIGFPHGMASAGKFPVWKTGHIASDLDLDFEGRPAFLIDATTKQGMSGSPVFARQYPVYRHNDGNATVGCRTRFLGIYSGHFHKVDVGRAWKPAAIREIMHRTG
jgi:hypothetical protein